jgi:hypothetical protein
MKNIKDSILFLLTSRKTISDFIVSETKLNDVDKVLAKNFIMNEASDYEIMSILMRSQFPDEKYNQLKENNLFDSLRIFISLNEDRLSTSINKNTMESILEIDSVSQYGFSTAIPVLEFIMEQYNMEDDEPRQGHDIGGKALSVGTTALFMRPKGGYKRSFIRYKNRKLPKQIASLKAAPGKMMSSLQKGRQAAMNGVASVAKFATSPTGKILSVVVIASLVALAATKIYRNKLSQAAKACSQYTGPEKQNCMIKFRRAAFQAQIAQLKSGMVACNGTKNPEKCQAHIAKKITSLQKKIIKS